MIEFEVFLNALTATAALGLLEAAWTYPDHGGPRHVWWGILAIFVVLVLTTWPYFWWIPLLAILEEMAQGFLGSGGTWRPTWDTVLHHWSTGVLGFNIYPYITFPIATAGGEVLFHVVVRL